MDAFTFESRQTGTPTNPDISVLFSFLFDIRACAPPVQGSFNTGALQGQRDVHRDIRIYQNLSIWMYLGSRLVTGLVTKLST